MHALDNITKKLNKLVRTRIESIIERIDKVKKSESDDVKAFIDSFPLEDDYEDVGELNYEQMEKDLVKKSLPVQYALLKNTNDVIRNGFNIKPTEDNKKNEKDIKKDIKVLKNFFNNPNNEQDFEQFMSDVVRYLTHYNRVVIEVTGSDVVSFDKLSDNSKFLDAIEKRKILYMYIINPYEIKKIYHEKEVEAYQEYEDVNKLINYEKVTVTKKFHIGYKQIRNGVTLAKWYLNEIGNRIIIIDNMMIGGDPVKTLIPIYDRTIIENNEYFEEAEMIKVGKHIKSIFFISGASPDEAEIWSKQAKAAKKQRIEDLFLSITDPSARIVRYPISGKGREEVQKRKEYAAQIIAYLGRNPIELDPKSAEASGVSRSFGHQQKNEFIIGLQKRIARSFTFIINNLLNMQYEFEFIPIKKDITQELNDRSIFESVIASALGTGTMTKEYAQKLRNKYFGDPIEKIPEPKF